MATSLSSIDEAIGKLISFDVNDANGTKVCKIAIFPTPELTIISETIIEFTITVEEDDSNKLTAKSSDQNAFKSCRYYDKSSLIFSFPWMQDSKWYPLAVWFYTIRNTLTKENISPWQPQEIIRRNFPILPLETIRPPYVTKILSGRGSLKGKRPYMEDVDISHVDIKISDASVVSYFGVFDGHGGSDCSQMISDEIPTKVTANLRNYAPPEEALYSAFLDTDTEFINTTNSNAGSTANFFLWNPVNYTGYLANVGDTRSVVSSGGIAVDLTRDQKASDPYEISRIIKRGGYVSNDRVLGILAVGRAFGDASLKPPVQGHKSLTAEPEITAYRPSSNDTFIIMATDGLWDVLSSQQAVDYVSNALISSDIDVEGFRRGAIQGYHEETIRAQLDKISQSLASHAYNLNSQDNITVMILLLTRSANMLDPKLTDSRDEKNETSRSVFKSDEQSSYENSRLSRTPPRPSAGVLDGTLYGKSTEKEDNNINTKKSQTLSPATEDLMDFLLDDKNF